MSGLKTSADIVQLYDRVGSWADVTRFYVDPALDRLTDLACFQHAQRLLEIGGGTGRFAARLLKHVLQPDAQYIDIEPSATMRTLAACRLAGWSARADVRDLQDGQSRTSAGWADRYVATYVLNVLSDDAAIHGQLDHAHDMLSPTGLLCVANQTVGCNGAQRAISDAWMRLYEQAPSVVGNCRLINVRRDYLDDSRWRVHHREIVCRFGFCSEVIVAGKCA